MGGKHNKGCCGCLIAEDSFDRDASNLGSNWTHPVDQWHTVASGAPEHGYAESQIDGARALHNTKHPLPHTSAHVWIAITNEVVDSGDIYRIILNAVDLDNYHYAEFVRNGQYDSVIRLGVRTGGTDSILKSQTITELLVTSEVRVFSALFSDAEFCADISTVDVNQIYLDGETPIALGYYAGMGADSGTRIAEWAFLQHRQTNPICQSCACKCLGNYIPPVIHAHVVGEIWDRFGPIEDDTWVYASDYECDFDLYWSPTAMWWSGSGRCVVGGQDIIWGFKLPCEPVDPGLTDIEAAADHDTATVPSYGGNGEQLGIIRVDAGWDCDPLTMVFQLPPPQATDFEYHQFRDVSVTITETP